MLLTSPDLPQNADDDIEIWSARAGAAVDDDQPNDRTRRATINGTVRVVYEAEGESFTRVVPISDRDPDARRTLMIRVRVHLEPYLDYGISPDPTDPNLQGPFLGANDGVFNFDDINGSGVHDAGEPSEPYLDLSRGVQVADPTQPETDYAQGDHPNNAVGDGRGPVVTNQHVLDQIERANVAWAQAGIKVEMVAGPIIEEVPVGAGGVGILYDGWLDIDPALDDVTVILDIGGAATSDVAVLIFTGPMRTATGYARVPANQGSSLPGTLGQNTYLFIAPNVPITNRTLAHEIGHALTNQGDSTSPPYIFFPFRNLVPPGGDTVAHQRRRIRRVTEVTARTPRDPVTCLTCSGNTLLIP